MDNKTDTRVRVVKSDEEWRRLLTAQQYDVTRKHGTEQAFTGPSSRKSAEPMPAFAAAPPCFPRRQKFESGTGWPSFFAPIALTPSPSTADRSWFMRRTEICCATCDAHLGHVFSDGPRPSGLRYSHERNGLDSRLAPAPIDRFVSPYPAIAQGAAMP